MSLRLLRFMLTRKRCFLALASFESIGIHARWRISGTAELQAVFSSFYSSETLRMVKVSIVDGLNLFYIFI